jgi:HNH endonuclease
MRCVICKEATSGNEPREHILPEGLGNTEHVLRRGVVCGRCNNYFARKVEKPFLELPAIATLRFDQAVPSKRGLVPPQDGIFMQGRCRVQAIKEPHCPEISITVPDEAATFFSSVKKGTLIFPMIPTTIEPSVIVARFLGKVGIEAFASRIEKDDALLTMMVQEERLDTLRGFVRYGEVIDWPISVRRIYDADSNWSDGERQIYQIMHEFDFLSLQDGEIYFVLALFGQEMVMNLGGPSLEGWENWLAEHDGISPLQHGKNAEMDRKI